ncbi:MAG: murein transglycosylase domain-containing protein [Pseudobdellovibrionaceae bacterium]
MILKKVLVLVYVLAPSIVFGNEILEGSKSAFEDLKSQTVQNWQSYKTIQDDNWEEYRSNIQKKWNDGLMPSAKTYVEYWNDDQSRLKVDYEKGNIQLQILSKDEIPSDRIVARLKTELLQKFNLIDSQASNVSGETLSIKNLDSAMSEFAKNIVIDRKFKGTDGVERKFYQIDIPMVPNHVKKRAAQFLPTVTFWAQKYSLPVGLILAIMWQESAFNPLARSHIPAFGLMQIVPKYAGLDVKAYLNESVNVDGSFLYAAENNIKYGVSYLNILSTQSFASIKSFENRVPFIIAGYNWGPNRLLKHLKKGSISLTSARDIKNQIIKIAPMETKDYLAKVVAKWKQIDEDGWLNL